MASRGLVTLRFPADIIPEPFDVIVSGGILAPWFRYGLDTDEDWLKIRELPGLVACLDTGNTVTYVASKVVRGITNISLAMQFYRSCSEVMDSVVGKNGWANRRPTGREREPLFIFFDSFCGTGEAHASNGGGYNLLPHHYDQRAFSERCLLDAWGTLHEMGHQHQNGWTFHDSTEVTNNVLVLTCYSYYSAVSLYRSAGGDGSFGIPEFGGGYCFLGHPYASVNGKGELNHWNTMLGFFGPDKLREFIHADAHQMYYNRNTYGRDQTWVLVAAKVLGYDFRKCLEFHRWGLDSQQNQKYVEELAKMNVKPWYPVMNAFQTGYEVDGTVFEMSRPYRIPYGQKTRFNFKTCTKTREGHGDFTIVKLIPGKGQWDEIEPGVYDYTPVSDPNILDEWRLVYHESTTDQTITSYGRIKLIVRGNTYERFTGITGNTVLEAYRNTKGRSPNAKGTGTGMNVANANGRFVTISRGTIYPKESGNYTFYAAPDERALLYLSRAPLKADPDVDAKYLILNDNGPYHGYQLSSPSDWRMLRANEPYYYCFVVYNTDGAGGGKVGYRINSKGDIVDFPSDRVAFPGVTLNDLLTIDDGWTPEKFEDLKGMSTYTGDLWMKPVVKSVKAPTEQNGASPNNLVDGNQNTQYATKWFPKESAVPFPQEYEVQFATKSSFDLIVLQPCGDTRRMIIDNLTVKCDDQLISGRRNLNP